MPDPQLESGYIRIANEVWDALVTIRIPGEARQVLDCIIRKTWGWGKKTDKIALSQLCEATGLKKTSIIKARKKLMAMNLITVTKKVNGTTISYGIIKDYNKWRPLPKKVTKNKKQTKLKDFCYLCNYREAIARHHIKLKSFGGSDEEYNIIILCPNCHALTHQGKYDEDFLMTQKGNVENSQPKSKTRVTKKVNKGVPKKLPTKDTITKDTTTKESILGIFEYWNSKKIIVHKSKDGCKGEINTRLKDYSPEEIKEAIDNYAEILHSGDYVFSYRWTLKDFLGREKDNVARFLNRSRPFESMPKKKLNPLDDWEE